MARYRLRAGNFKHREGGELLEAGDELEMSVERAALLADRFEPVAPPPPPEDAKDWSDVLDRNSHDAIAAITDVVSTADEARSLIEAEEAGKNRKGVLAAANARLAELEA